MSRFSLRRLMICLAVCVSTATLRAQTVGVLLSDPRSSPGFTLFAPNRSSTTWLIDEQGREVHSWVGDSNPALSVYLLGDGHLLRAAALGRPITDFNAGGAGGRVQEYDWDGALLWEYELATSQQRLHHDIERLPNGNVLVIAWELKTSAQAVAAGRNPALIQGGAVWPDSILEIAPTFPTGGTIVWEWHVWDHLVQDFDPGQANFGNVAASPELVDINFTAGPPASDWLHVNGVDYLPTQDQIVISVHDLSEFWILDHGTTTAEAASHAGGRQGKGGDLLYRWGNPLAYRAGTSADQQLFVQHDAQWIEPGLAGEGNILLFNNGTGRPGGNHSTVDEIVTPIDGSGAYPLMPGSAFAPAAPTWTYVANPPASLYARNISGAQRLANGNTLICNGPIGTFIEVTPGRSIELRPPDEVSPPGALQPLLFVNPSTLTWEDAAVSGSDTFNVYRGDLMNLRAGDRGACLLAAVLLSTASDPTPPPPSGAWVYLVTGINAQGEGSMGADSFGFDRINGTPCP